MLRLFEKTQRAIRVEDGPQKSMLVAEPIDKEFQREYSRVATTLGVAACDPYGMTKLSGVLSEEQIQIYNLEAVELYMDKQGFWGWFPMRAKDCGYRDRPRRITPTTHPTLYGSGEREVYRLPIPLPVLLTAERIIERMGDEAIFFVGAIRTNPDPFLAVMSLRDNSRTMYVIERWDEPGFRG